MRSTLEYATQMAKQISMNTQENPVLTLFNKTRFVFYILVDFFKELVYNIYKIMYIKGVNYA